MKLIYGLFKKKKEIWDISFLIKIFLGKIFLVLDIEKI